MEPPKQLFITLPDGKTRTLDFGVDDTIAELKSKAGLGPDVRLQYGGKQLEPEKRVKDYNIGRESTLVALGRLRGGAPGLYPEDVPPNAHYSHQWNGKVKLDDEGRSVVEAMDVYGNPARQMDKGPLTTSGLATCSALAVAYKSKKGTFNLMIHVDAEITPESIVQRLREFEFICNQKSKGNGSFSVAIATGRGTRPDDTTGSLQPVLRALKTASLSNQGFIEALAAASQVPIEVDPGDFIVADQGIATIAVGYSSIATEWIEAFKSFDWETATRKDFEELSGRAKNAIARLSEVLDSQIKHKTETVTRYLPSSQSALKDEYDLFLRMEKDKTW